MNPLKLKVNEEKLTEHWFNILERYYRETDESKYIEFINELKIRSQKELEMVILDAAFFLHTLGVETGTETLKQNGITGSVKSKILQKQTKYRMYLAKEKSKHKDVAQSDFYEIIGDISLAKKVNLNTEMMLQEWVGILKSLKKQIEIDNRFRNLKKK